MASWQPLAALAPRRHFPSVAAAAEVAHLQLEEGVGAEEAVEVHLPKVLAAAEDWSALEETGLHETVSPGSWCSFGVCLRAPLVLVASADWLVWAVCLSWTAGSVWSGGPSWSSSCSSRARGRCPCC